LVGVSLRAADVPRGVLVTAIERGREVIRPTGDTVVCAGDRLTVLGAPDDLVLLKELASPEG
jgi:Trk K+ transport system NAD-binding subunit